MARGQYSVGCTIKTAADQNGRGQKRPQTNKAARQNGRMNRSFHLAVVVHLYTYRCHCCVLYTGL